MKLSCDLNEKILPPPPLSLSLTKPLIMDDPETKEMLRDLLWLNAVIATELIQVTENTSAILRKSPPPESCLIEHNELRKTALAIAERYRPGTMLKQHITKHQ